MVGYKMIILLAFLVDGVFGADPDKVSGNEGESVTLNPGVIKKQDEIMQWHFNNTRIAHINRHPNTSCSYDGEGGIFRDRLKMDYETGSLTITDIRTEHAGRYEAEFIRSGGSGTEESLNRNRKCDRTKIKGKNSKAEIIKTLIVTVTAPGKEELRMDIEDHETDKSSGLSSGVVTGIVVAVLLGFVAAAVGVIKFLCSKSRKGDEEIRKRELL